MKSKPIFYALGALALAAWLALPVRSSGQADADATAVAALITEVLAQQVAITENHTKIDEKIAAISEELRVSRIFSSRGGGKAGAQ